MCDHEGQPCPGRSCRCVCDNCQSGGLPQAVGPVKYTYPRFHRVANAENRKTGETLGAYGFEHKEGWASDGANFTGPGAYERWTSAVNQLAKGGKR